MSSPLFRLQSLAEAATSDDGLNPVLNRLAASSALAEAVLAYLQRPVELHPTLRRVREKLAARLYSPAAEEDVSALLDLLTDTLARMERRVDPPSLNPDMPPFVTGDWMSLRPAIAWTRIAQAVDLPFGEPLEVAAAVEALVQKVAHAAGSNAAPQPSKPDEWGATDIRTEMERVDRNIHFYLDDFNTVGLLGLAQQRQAVNDLRATLAALYRADSVIAAQAHDLAKERENSAALRAEINDVVAERNQLAEAIQAANRPETHNRIPALPGVEHYTDTLAKLPDVEARLRWVLAAVYSQQHAIIEVSVPPDLLREALTELDYLRSLE